MFIMCAALLSFSFAKPAFADNSATAFVQGLGDTALMSLTGKDINRKTRETRVRAILRKNFDLPSIGKFALGTQWRQTSDKERAEYMDLFEDMIVQTYTTRFEDYSGQELKVDKSITDKNGDFLVASQVIQKEGPAVNLQWRIRNKDGALRVEDVIVENISMSLTQRSDFAAVMQQGGGVESLLVSLRERSKKAAEHGKDK